jgi:DNA-binding NtrC family response regulator
MSNDSAISIQAARQFNHILVVEDDVALRFTLAEWLRSLNYMVCEAASADEAATILSSPIVVDLVVTDVEMPGSMNGFGLVDHIRRVAPGITAIVVSGNAFQQQAREIGVPFFRKPYDLDSISALIATMLPHHPVEDNDA